MFIENRYLLYKHPIRAATIYRDIRYIAIFFIYRDIFYISRYFLYIAICDISRYFFGVSRYFWGFHDKNLRGNRRKSTVIGRN